MDWEGSAVGRPAGWGEVETDGAEEDAGTGGRDEGAGEGGIGLVVRGDGSGVVALNDEEKQGAAAGADVFFELLDVARSSRRGGVREAGDTLHDEGDRLDLRQDLGAAGTVQVKVEAASSVAELPLERPSFPDARDESAGEQIFREAVRKGGVEGDPGAGRVGGTDEGDGVAGGPGGAARGRPEAKWGAGDEELPDPTRVGQVGEDAAAAGQPRRDDEPVGPGQERGRDQSRELQGRSSGKESARLQDGQALRIGAGELDGIPGPYLPFLQDAQVKAGATAGQEPLRESARSHPDPQLVARRPRLTDLEEGASHLEHVSDVDLPLQHPFHGEVLAELAESQVAPAELPLPEIVVLERVGVDRLVGPSVDPEIRLAVPFQVQPSDPDAARDRLLEDPCRDGPPARGDLPGL